MKVVADLNVCIGAGVCVMTAPELFDQGPDGLVEVLVAEVPPDEESLAREAVDLCPSGALSIAADGEQ